MTRASTSRRREAARTCLAASLASRHAGRTHWLSAANLASACVNAERTEHEARVMLVSAALSAGHKHFGSP